MKLKSLLSVLFLVMYVLLLPSPLFAQSKQNVYEAEIKQVTAIKTQLQNAQTLSAKVDVLSGKLKGREFTAIINVPVADKNLQVNYKKGDHVLISYELDPQNKEHVYIVDYIRQNQLLVLFFLFLVFVFTIGRWKGFLSFVGMIFSFLIISKFIVPSIILGNDPMIISLMGAVFMLPVLFYLGHGFNKKTHIALASTFLSLLLTGLLTYAFVFFTRLTGYGSEDATFVQATLQGAINIQSLLIAGVIIGAMGILDDVTISQTAVVEKLAEANPKYTFKQLYAQSIAIGRDHIASLINTLILVYTGASLPLLLLFYNSQLPLLSIMNQEIVATEIVRTLVSSIGIIAAVPIATLLACWLEKK